MTGIYVCRCSCVLFHDHRASKARQRRRALTPAMVAMSKTSRGLQDILFVIEVHLLSVSRRTLQQRSELILRRYIAAIEKRLTLPRCLVYGVSRGLSHAPNLLEQAVSFLGRRGDRVLGSIVRSIKSRVVQFCARRVKHVERHVGLIFGRRLPKRDPSLHTRSCARLRLRVQTERMVEQY